MSGSFAHGKKEIYFLQSIRIDEKLRLRDDVMPRARKRDWLFKGVVKDDTILLAHEIDEYTWEVTADYIDWEEYQKRKTSFVFTG